MSIRTNGAHFVVGGASKLVAVNLYGKIKRRESETERERERFTYNTS